MTKFKSTIALRLILFTLLSVSIIFAGRPFEKQKDNRSKLQKVTTNDVFTAMTINNIFSYYNNNGDGSLNPFSGDGGFELMNSNRGITIFEEGFVWGGKHLKDGAIKVGGSTYNHGLQAGRIVTAGTTSAAPVASDPSLASNGIYRVRPDVGPSTTFNLAMEDKMTKQEVNVFGKYEILSAKHIYDDYVSDWNNWPAAEGAPFEDKDANGIYDPAVDVPGVPGSDQTIWYVSNDLDGDLTNHLYGSAPFGIEFQRTIWAYKRTGALGNTVFQKNIIINKSGYNIDSMYVAQWSDPDLGGGLGYTDDVTGCDTLLGLGYVYNGDNADGFFGAKAPAAGFDFFQGPLIPGAPTDSGKANGKYIKGKKNLAMTSFNFFINSNATYTDPRLQDPRGTTEWYNLFQGLVGRTGAAYVNPKTNLVTKFVLSGDPVAGTGWIEDGTIAPPGDRRMASCAGPFTMANGDTQEIVVAAIIGQGNSNLNSVSVLKSYDGICQLAYDNNFDLAAPPAAPVVALAELEGKVILSWGDPVAANATENLPKNGYSFQGYNVYQVPDAGFNNARKLATYDLNDGILIIKDDIYDESVDAVLNKPVQFGTDNGVKRYYEVTKDVLGDKPLISGQSYYFAVTAYNYNPTPISSFPYTLESSPQVIKVIPQSLLPGQKLQSKFGDTVAVTHTGLSGGSVVATIVDPKNLTGHDYEVSFDTTGGSFFWKLTDKTLNKIILTNQTNESGDDNYFITDGMQVKVQGPPPGMKPGVQGSAISASTDIGFELFKGTRAFTWAGAAAFGMEGFGGTMGGGFNFGDIFGVPGSTIAPDKITDVLIEFAQTDAVGAPINLASDTVSLAYRYLRNAQVAAAVPAFAPFIINTASSYGYQDRRSSPIRIYEWNDVTRTKGKRLNFGFLENNVATGLVDGLYFPKTNAQNATYAAATDPREWFFIFASEYNAATPDPLLTVNVLNVATPMLYFWTAQRNGTAWADKAYILHSYKPNTVADKFVFAPKAMTYSATAAKADIAKVNVFPNPYFGMNTKEANKYNKFVTFNHLPPKATLSIVNLAGVRVKKLVKDNTDQFLKWDLTNEAGLPVASGMYVIYVDMGSLGTKILKFAVIQELQQLDKY